MQFAAAMSCTAFDQIDLMISPMMAGADILRKADELIGILKDAMGVNDKGGEVKWLPRMFLKPQC